MGRKSGNSNSALVVKATASFRMHQEVLSWALGGDGGTEIAKVDPTLHEPPFFLGKTRFWFVNLSGQNFPHEVPRSTGTARY